MTCFYQTTILVLAVSSCGSAFAATRDAAPVVLPGSSTRVVTPTVDTGMSVGGYFVQAAVSSGAQTSLVAPDENWEREDLLQVIVRESSQSRIKQDRDLEKKGSIKAEVAKLSSFDFGSFSFSPTASDSLPGIQLGAEKAFESEGEYKRHDEMTDRLTARVVEVKPNGNLVIEARVFRNWSGDTTEIRMTGVVDPEMVTTAKTILSNQIYDLKIEKVHSGPVEDSTQQGFFAEVLNFLFAF